MSFAHTARYWGCVAALGLVACAGGPERETTPEVQLDWPELGGSQQPEIGGGEADAVVIVAIENYANLAPVTGALKSAKDWYDYFTQVLRVPAARVQLETLLVTQGKMRAAVQRAKAQVRGRGRLWVVFIGHGAPIAKPSGSQSTAADGLLVESFASPDALTGLRHSELMALVKPAAKSRREPVVILDAAYSGKVSTGSGSDAEPLTGAAMPELRFEPPAVPNVITMSAAASDQAAYPLPGSAPRRLAFSYLLLGGLRGWADLEGDADGAVSAEEAVAFTRTVLQRLGRVQTPQLSGRVSAPLVRAGDVPPFKLPGDVARLASR
jgi:caspase domain-containing protein